MILGNTQDYDESVHEQVQEKRTVQLFDKMIS